MFGRKGQHLTLLIPVTFPEAALALKLRFLLRSFEKDSKIPGGTKSEQLFRVKGRGVQNSKAVTFAGYCCLWCRRIARYERAAIEALREVMIVAPERRKRGGLSMIHCLQHQIRVVVYGLLQLNPGCSRPNSSNL